MAMPFLHDENRSWHWAGSLARYITPLIDQLAAGQKNIT
jgi:hypothetical protein